MRNDPTESEASAEDGGTSEVAETASAESGEAAELDSTAPVSTRSQKSRFRLGRLRLALLAPYVVIAAVAAVAIVLGLKWSAAQSDLDEIRSDQATTAETTALAKEYTRRSLTYDYRDMKTFFAGVEQDATESLKAEYRKARPDLQTLMTTAQVVASGEIVATSVLWSTDDRYEFAVTALQKTKNLQQPEEQLVPNVLKVVVVRSGDGWSVDKYSAM